MDRLLIAGKEFINHCLFEKNLSPKTIKAYQIDLKQLWAFLLSKGDASEIAKITKVELREFIESISHLKPKSVKRKIATLKAMFNFFEFEDKITVNPFRKMRIRIKEDKRLPCVLNIKEMGDIFKSAYKKEALIKRKGSYSYFESMRNIVIVELLFITGARVSEIANLRDEQIDLNSGEVLIKGKGGKERLIQICNKETISILRKYRKLYIDRIIATGGFFLANRLNCKLSDQSIRSIVRNLSGEACIQMHVTPHVFRHSFATLLLEKEVDIKYIQLLLGHSSIVTTQIYTHVNREKQKQILRTKHPRKDFSPRNF